MGPSTAVGAMGGAQGNPLASTAAVGTILSEANMAGPLWHRSPPDTSCSDKSEPNMSGCEVHQAPDPQGAKCVQRNRHGMGKTAAKALNLPGNPRGEEIDDRRPPLVKEA